MVLSDEKITVRLSAVDRTVESIETTSMWVIHHRDSAAQIASCWMEAFKIGLIFSFNQDFFNLVKLN